MFLIMKDESIDPPESKGGGDRKQVNKHRQRPMGFATAPPSIPSRHFKVHHVPEGLEINLLKPTPPQRINHNLDSKGFIHPLHRFTKVEKEEDYTPTPLKFNPFNAIKSFKKMHQKQYDPACPLKHEVQDWVSETQGKSIPYHHQRDHLLEHQGIRKVIQDELMQHEQVLKVPVRLQNNADNLVDHYVRKIKADLYKIVYSARNPNSIMLSEQGLHL